MPVMAHDEVIAAMRAEEWLSAHAQGDAEETAGHTAQHISQVV